MESIDSSGFSFYINFDSANLAKVSYIPPNESPISLTSITSNTKAVPLEIPDAEFNVWTRPDCCGTEFENGNRTWFYFGIKAPQPCLLVRLNIVDLNRQGKMYSQGMAPVCRTVPGKLQWERVRDKPTYNTTDDIFTVSFKYKTSENTESVTYFAFTYPFSYNDLQRMLMNIDLKFQSSFRISEDDIYYAKEVVCRSLEARDVYLITISSYHGITSEREARLKNLFPDESTKRPHKFSGKKLIFISARVHPGETPSTFVFNGLLNLLLCREDPVAIMLRRFYVFKMIPFLNPDGVARGHYRTDTRGVNLNRVYLNPLISQHPSVYAARSLICYYHSGREDFGNTCENCEQNSDGKSVARSQSEEELDQSDDISNESGLFLYIDMHGHASKKGIFMYGNHFEDHERNVECRLLPKLMSLNNHNFHFTACNFTERNMYLRDRRDGMSREGSGRVAVLKLTGLTKSYTLECNYNTGRLVNVLAPTIREPHNKIHLLPVPPKYNPQIFEEVGKSLGASILDLTSQNPCTRLANSEFHSLSGLKDWLRVNNNKESDAKMLSTKFKIKNLTGLNNQAKTSMKARQGPNTKRLASKAKPHKVPIEKKENIIVPSCSMAESSGSYVDKSEERCKKAATFRLNKKGIVLKAKAKKCKLTAAAGSGNTEMKPKLGKNKEKTNLATSQKVRLQKKSNYEKVKRINNEQDRTKLREISFLKSSEGTSQFKVDGVLKDVAGDDLLGIAWKFQPSSKKFQKKVKSSETGNLPPDNDVGASGSGKALYFGHNFAKLTNSRSTSKTKLKKHNLRRLTSSTDVGKVEKVKRRKKIKSKC